MEYRRHQLLLLPVIGTTVDAVETGHVDIEVLGVTEHEDMVVGVAFDAEERLPVPHPAGSIIDLTGLVDHRGLPGVVEDGAILHGDGRIGTLTVEIGIDLAETFAAQGIEHIGHLMAVVPVATAVVIHQEEGVARGGVEQHRLHLMHTCLTFHEDGRDFAGSEVDLPQRCQVLLIDTVDDLVALLVDIELQPPGVLELGLLEGAVDNARRVGLRIYLTGEGVDLQCRVEGEFLIKCILLLESARLVHDPDHHIATFGTAGNHRTDSGTRRTDHGSRHATDNHFNLRNVGAEIAPFTKDQGAHTSLLREEIGECYRFGGVGCFNLFRTLITALVTASDDCHGHN